MNALDLLTAGGTRATPPKSGAPGSGREEAANNYPETGEDAFAALLGLVPPGSSDAAVVASVESAAVLDLSSEIGGEVPFPAPEGLPDTVPLTTPQPASPDASVRSSADGSPVAVAPEGGRQGTGSAMAVDPGSGVVSTRGIGPDGTLPQAASPVPAGPASLATADLVPGPGTKGGPALPPAADPAEIKPPGSNEVTERTTQAAQTGPSASTHSVASTVTAGPSAASIAGAVSLSGAEVRGVEVFNGDAMPWSLRSDAGGSAPAAQTSASVQSPTPSPQAVAAQIATTVTKTEAGTVVLRLDPPELGRVQIELVPQDEGLRATLLAERPETQEFLRRHADALLRELASAGHSHVMLDFATGTEDQDAPQEQGFGLAGGTHQAAGDEEAPALADGSPATHGRLDVRL